MSNSNFQNANAVEPVNELVTAISTSTFKDLILQIEAELNAQGKSLKTI